MSVLFWVATVAVGLPTVVVASYPIHAWIVQWRSRRYRPVYSPASVSVLVPLKGQDEGRTQALRRLITQQTSGSIEWLFCVEHDADPAVPELRELAATDPDRIQVLITGPSGTRLGKMHNLIEGAAAARGERLVFVDADTILPHARFLRDFTAPLDDEGVGLITCFPAYRWASSIPAAMLAGAINHDLLGHFALETVWGGLRLANGSCMAIRRDVLEYIGGFRPQEASLLMDVILARRVHAAGYRVLMHHEPVEVPCRTVTYRVWWNQAHRWQVGMAHVLSGPFYTWYCWMRSVFPVSLLLALFASGTLMGLGAAAIATRLSVNVVMSQCFIRDRTQLKYLWLLPFLDTVTAFGCWYALVVDRVEWRGRVYHVQPGGVTRRLA
jgi:ceramide glucosyltransferase